MAGREYFNEIEKNNLIRVVSAHFKMHEIPFGHTSNLTLPVFLLLQVLVNECFSHYNCDPMATLIRFTFCDLD